jgi:hypothetical protein
MNEHGHKLFQEVLRLCEGVDAVEAVTAVVTALGVLVANTAAKDRIEPLTEDVIRALHRSVQFACERGTRPTHQ